MHLRIAENHNKLNRSRFIVNVAAAAQAAGVKAELIEDGWIIRLIKKDQVRYVYGDKFDLNSSAAGHIAHDKAAMAAVLHQAGISAVRHQPLLIVRGARGHNTCNAAQVQAFWRSAPLPVVCKPLEGSCGTDIYLLRSPAELHAFVQRASSSQAWALAPFVPVAAEYRTVVVDGEVQLQYAKIPAWHHVGKDGLVSGAAGASPVQNSFAMHGLSKGGRVQPIDDQELKAGLASVALRVAALASLRCASVDIVAVQSREELLVLEVNDGIALDAYGAQNHEAHTRALSIYTLIIQKMFTD